MEGAKRRGNLY